MNNSISFTTLKTYRIPNHLLELDECIMNTISTINMTTLVTTRAICAACNVVEVERESFQSCLLCDHIPSRLQKHAFYISVFTIGNLLLLNTLQFFTVSLKSSHSGPESQNNHNFSLSSISHVLKMILIIQGQYYTLTA